jgi:hypothetical protein
MIGILARLNTTRRAMCLATLLADGHAHAEGRIAYYRFSTDRQGDNETARPAPGWCCRAGSRSERCGERAVGGVYS